MARETIDDNLIDFQEEKEKRERPPEPPKDKPIDSKIGKIEIQRALCLLYNLGHRLARIDKRYKPGDFVEEADGIMDLVNQHTPLRIILRLASPLAAIGALWEKVEDTMATVRKRKEAATGPGQPVPVTGDPLPDPVKKSKAPFKA